MESVEWVQKQFDKGNKTSIYTIATKTNLTNIISLGHSGDNAIAGPIYACAVLLDKNFRTRDLKAAKDMTKEEYQELASKLKLKSSIHWSLGQIAACHTIACGTKEAINSAYIAALINIGYVGKFDMIISKPFTFNIVPYKIKNIPIITSAKMDELCDGVMLATILARACRDAFMVSLDYRYPGFGWNTNSGYATQKHLEAIKEYGITPEHHNLENVRSLSGLKFKVYRKPE